MPGHKNINDLLKAKSCGNRHAWCSICRPNRRSPYTNGGSFGFKNPLNIKKGALTRIRNGSHVGERNGNWRGGEFTNPHAHGWSIVVEKVLERDKVCGVCELPKYKNRRFDIHHVTARRNGGTNDVSNLVAVHHGCHMKLEVGKVKLRKSVGEA